MNLQEYKESGHADYAAFAGAVAQILETAIRAYDENIPFLPIQQRAKGFDSLEKKIDDRKDDRGNGKKIDSENIEEGIKDLAGVRVIFYTNSDVDWFLSSGIFGENFDVDHTTYHHPDPTAGEKASQFRSVNIVVRLQDNRTELLEYAKFKGMRCEIQVQTILNHAWSEMGHDIIYKKPILPRYGKDQLEKLKKQLDAIMLEHLVPAGDKFQSVWDAYQRLLAGKPLMESDSINELMSLKNNNERLDILEGYREYVLGYLDEYERDYPGIRTRLTRSAITAFKIPPIAREILGVKFDGVTATEYLEEILTILNEYRRFDAEGTLDDFFKLYDKAPEEAQRNKITTAAEKFAGYDLNITDMAGLRIQQIVWQKIMALTDKEVTDCLGLVLALSKAVLSIEVNGISSTYNSWIFLRGSILPDDEIRKIRRSILERLITVYKLLSSKTEKREVIQILNTITSLSIGIDCSDDLMRDVINDSAFVARFYASIVEDETHEILQILEHNLFWWYHRTAHVREPKCSRADTLQAKAELDEAIATFRKSVEVNDGYKIHKTLVGFGVPLDQTMWENKEAISDISGDNEYRKERIAEFVEQVSPESANRWFDDIVQALQAGSNSMAILPHMDQFLQKIGEQKPAIAVDYLARLEPDKPTERAAYGLLTGLARSKSAAKVDKIIDAWLEKNMFLPVVAYFSSRPPTVNIDRLVRLVKRAIQCDDMKLILPIVQFLFASAQDVKEIEQRVFVPILKFAIDKKDTTWVKTAGLLLGEIPHLSDETLTLMIDSMVYMPRITYENVLILNSLGAQNPELIVRLFDKRMEAAGDDYDFKEFQPVPYLLDGLEETFQKVPEATIAIVRKHYASNKRQAFCLLRMAFPRITDDLEKHLRDLIAGGKRDDIIYVIDLLCKYEGARGFEDIAKEIIKALPVDDVLWGRIGTALEAWQEVCGEFGYVEFYRERRTLIKKWENDPCEKVRKFAGYFIHRMDNAINNSQKRAEENIARRKSVYGDDDGGSYH